MQVMSLVYKECIRWWRSKEILLLCFRSGLGWSLLINVCLERETNGRWWFTRIKKKPNLDKSLFLWRMWWRWFLKITSEWRLMLETALSFEYTMNEFPTKDTQQMWRLYLQSNLIHSRQDIPKSGERPKTDNQMKAGDVIDLMAGLLFKDETEESTTGMIAKTGFWSNSFILQWPVSSKEGL